MTKKILLCMMLMLPMMAQAQESSESPIADVVNDLTNIIGFDMFEEEIDNVIFQTNEFLTDPTFTGSSGPFWWILEMCMALGALFAIIMAAGQAYKMMVKGEAFDVLKVLRVLGIAIVMFMWYPKEEGQPCILGMLAYIPNCIGSYTHDLYEIEAAQVQDKFEQLMPKISERDDSLRVSMAEYKTSVDGMSQTADAITMTSEYNAITDSQKKGNEAWISSTYAGVIVCLDKLVLLASLMLFRIGWWGTIYCQQILLGMLTIFGPIMWAFSILPKWEGAWAKWISRYLTVHFYGAMLYFVGFRNFVIHCVSVTSKFDFLKRNKPAPKLC